MKRKQRFLKSSALVGCILLGVGIVMGSAGFVAMGCDLDAFTYPRGTPWTPWKSTRLWGMSPWSGPPVRRRWKSS